MKSEIGSKKEKRNHVSCWFKLQDPAVLACQRRGGFDGRAINV